MNLTDEEVCRDYEQGPFGLSGSVQTTAARVRGHRSRWVPSRDRSDRDPGAFFHGDSDSFVPYVDSLQAVLDMPSFDKRIKIYPGAKHDLVNETNRQEVIADLSHWVAGVLH